MEKEILKVLAYFDVFRHPLTKDEIASIFNLSSEDSSTLFKKLTEGGKCFEKNNYLSISKHIDEYVATRILKEKSAEKYIQKIPSYVKIIKRFPFVRGIAISGSLSKGVMHENGDIDYFIITSPNRLWIARTALILFKKIFLFNSKKYFCINYLVDENNFEIQDKNIFTAVEVSFLVPVFNKEILQQFKEANNWSKQYIPNEKNVFATKDIQVKSKFRKLVEFPLKGKLGDKLDLLFMKITAKRWEKKFPYFDKEKFELTMRSNRGISKHHPQDFQNKVLKEYRLRIKELHIN